MKIIVLLFNQTWFLGSSDVNSNTNPTIYFESEEYTGCQDGSEALRNHTLSGVTHILSSQSQYYVDKRIELGLLNIDNLQIKRLEEPTDNSACEQINTILNEYQVGWNDPMSPVYYEVGGFFFASFGLQTGGMLGFRPIYMFNNDFELVFIWVV